MTELIKPLVSVCMITYNHESYIAQAIESVLMQQTDFEYELVIGEDCSTDETRAIVRAFGDRYPQRIRVLLAEHNQGSYGNAVATLTACRGQYIASLEGDDYWIDPTKLQQQVAFLDSHPEFSICAHWVQNIDDSGSVIEPPIFTGSDCPETFNISDALAGIIVHANSWLFRNNLSELEKYFSLLKHLPPIDNALLLIILKHGQGYCINAFLGAYRYHPSGMWTSRSRHIKAFDILSYYYLIPIITDGLFAEASKKLIHSYQNRVISALSGRRVIRNSIELINYSHKTKYVPMTDVIILCIKSIYSSGRRIFKRVFDYFNHYYIFDL